MRAVLQRVTRVSVTIEGATRAAIGRGLLVLLGVHADDTTAEADWMAAKCAALRIFDDRNGVMNLSVCETAGEVLVVSQFTLLADCRKGRRPSWHQAAPPAKGKELYEYFVEKLRNIVPRVTTGVFGAMMDVELVNSGPVTIVLERRAGEKAGESPERSNSTVISETRRTGPGCGATSSLPPA